MSDAQIGYGAKFEVENPDSPGAFVEIAEVTDITPPSSSVDVIDVTHMQSAGSTREFIQGLTDPGEVSFTMNFVPGSTSDEYLQDWRTARETRSARITFPAPIGETDSVTWEFDAFITQYQPAIPLADKMTAQVTCKVTGSTVTGVAS